MLTPQGRLAMLAHEVAHDANGSSEYRLLVVTALATLRRWYELVHPITAPQVIRRAVPRRRNLVDWILPFYLFHRWGATVLRRSQPRTEYLADQLAAEAASSAAVIDCLESMTVAAAATKALAKAIDARVPSHPWRLVRDVASAMPDDVRRELSAHEEQAGASVDATHPPTHLRIRMIRERPALPGTVFLPAETSAALDAELAPAADRLAQRVTAFARRD